ncbi:MAG: alpha/beta hydrolase [Microcoleaceae cyanobacterium]
MRSLIDLVKRVGYVPVKTSLCSQVIHTAAVIPTSANSVSVDSVSVDSVSANSVSANSKTGRVPLLLLHGYDSSLLEFYRLVPQLVPQIGATHEIWIVDLLGFGFTERPLNLQYGPEAIREHLYAFWRNSIQKPMVVVGTSMGGAAALDLALTYPEMIEQLILVNSVGYSGSFPIGRWLPFPLDTLAVEFWRQRKLVALNVSQSFDQSLNQWFGLTPDQKVVLRAVSLHLEMPGWSSALLSFMKSGGYMNLASRIPQIDRPTLILWGDSDELLGTASAWKFKRDLANSQLKWISCGHSPHLEQPQIVAELIRQFLQTEQK